MITTACLLTCHKKAPAFNRSLKKAGFSVCSWENFDTDTLGQFGQDSAPKLDIKKSALFKAQLACELSGYRYGLGSCGNFGVDPWSKRLSWNEECVAMWDAEESYGITEMIANSHTNYASTTIYNIEQALAFAQYIGFPEHGIVIGNSKSAYYYRSPECLSEFLRDVKTLLLTNSDGIFLQTDMRAHQNPTRMGNINLATNKLAAHLSRLLCLA